MQVLDILLSISNANQNGTLGTPALNDAKYENHIIMINMSLRKLSLERQIDCSHLQNYIYIVCTHTHKKKKHKLENIQDI